MCKVVFSFFQLTKTHPIQSGKNGCAKYFFLFFQWTKTHPIQSVKSGISNNPLLDVITEGLKKRFFSDGPILNFNLL